MMEFNLWKQLKKRLRRSRRPLWMLGSLLLGITLLLTIATAEADAAKQDGEKEAEERSVIRVLEEREEPLSVMLHRQYICGEDKELLGEMASSRIIQMLAAHPEWTAMLAPDGETVMLQQNIEDFSESCKGSAYIGVDKNGNLSLFDGVPKKEKVVRTFFQLDVEYMESSLPQNKVDELAHGIPISDIDEYNSVLSTYSDYAMPDNEKVMKPTY